MTSLRQIEANRRNALKSTGPKTELGKQQSRCNAARHGLTADAIVGFPAEDDAARGLQSNAASVADARINLRDLSTKIVMTTVERLRAPRADVVVADPSRAGLGRKGAAVIAATRAPRIGAGEPQ